MKKFNILFILSIVFLTGCLTKPKGPVVARFDGTTLTKPVLMAKLERLPRELQSVMSRRKKEFVEEMVNEHFLEKEAKKRHLENEADVKDLLAAARQKILISKLIETEVDKKVSLLPDEASEYYQAHREEFMTPLLLRASHILLHTEEEAGRVKAQLDAGADFEELARTKSLDSTAIRGGDIGFFQKGQLIPEFEAMAFAMKKGQVSEVFKTQFGFHVMKLTDRAEPGVRDFKSVKSRVERQILNEKRVKRFQDFIQSLKGNVKVTIDEKVLNEI